MGIGRFAKHFMRSFCDLAYPPLCLHCQGTLDQKRQHLCEYCWGRLELIDAKERCPYCFSCEYLPCAGICEECQGREPRLHRIAAALDYEGPAATLIREFKYGQQIYLGKGIGALMAMQFIALEWPFPDLIIPMPISRMHWLERGYNQSLLIAQALASILQRPMIDLMRRRSGDYSQAGLSRKERLNLSGKTFFITNMEMIADQKLLLVDDVMTTGSTFERCAEVLLNGCPEAIYGLAACRAI